MDKAVHALRILAWYILANIEISNDSAKGGGERRNVKGIDRTDAAFAVNDAVPSF